jgi:iron complex transport system permease protein
MNALTLSARVEGRPRRALLLIVLSLVLAGAALASLGAGAAAVGSGEALEILLARIGLGSESGAASHDAIVVAIRLPRTLLGVLAGAALAVAGAVLQGLFRNPLVDPGLIGVSGGAALAAATVLVLGETFVAGLPRMIAPLVLPVAAFGGGLAAVVVVQGLARVGGRTSISGLLLSGIAVGSLAGAATGLLLFIASDAQLRSVTFWSLGSLNGATWAALTGVAPLVLLALVLALRLAPGLNLFLLGEAEAGHLGLDVEKLKWRGVASAALAVGAGVAVTGIIGFVGLVVPHLVRLLGGPDHRSVLPASALLGASLLLLADVFARTAAAPAEVPIGVVTALIGAPFLLWLLRRRAFGRELA